MGERTRPQAVGFAESADDRSADVARCTARGEDGDMNEREAFIEAIATNPDEDTPRLAFADWLQENGEEARAEFVRLTCALARRPYQWDDPDRDRVIGLLSRHLPEWFGELFATVGMPRPTPTRDRTPPWGRWRYGPYSLGHGWGPNDGASVHDPDDEPTPGRDGLFVRSVGEDEDPPIPRPSWLLSYIGLERGFVNHLNVVPADGVVWGPLARAFRLEPIHELAIELDSEPDHWLALSDPCLRRVRALQVRLADTGGPVPDCTDAVAAVLADPTLSGVRELGFEGADPRPLSARDLDEPGQRFAAPELVERVLQSSVANATTRLRLHVGREGARAFASGGALTNLRSLELAHNGLDPSDRVALNQYRDRLEHLRFDEETFDLGPLLAGPPWARLERLTVPSGAIGARDWEVLARPDMFPALERLRFAGWSGGSDSSSATLIGAFRSGGFARLTHLDLTGFHLSSNAALALAAAVAPTQIRELNLRSTYGLTEKQEERILELLGDRVHLPTADDPIPF
jgi:uncharacterized protein (TIGR02996 family)